MKTRLKANSKLAKKLRMLGLTQRDFARIANQNVTLVNHFCINGIKTARIAKKYAKLLDCEPESLIDF